MASLSILFVLFSLGVQLLCGGWDALKRYTGSRWCWKVSIWDDHRWLPTVYKPPKLWYTTICSPS